MRKREKRNLEDKNILEIEMIQRKCKLALIVNRRRLSFNQKTVKRWGEKIVRNRA